MERRQYLKTASIAATGGLTTLAGCSSSGTEGDGDSAVQQQQTTDGTDEATENSNRVLMITEGSQYYFDPVGLLVEKGDSVTFQIKRGNHSATAYQEGNGPASVTRIPDAAAEFDSGTLSEQGATFEHRFETVGTFDYYCIPHKSLGMVGRIVVGEPGGPAEGNMPPDGTVPESKTIVEKGSVSHRDFTG